MNFNKSMIGGFLTRDPQLSYLPSQTPVVDFGVATNRKWTAQDGSQREEVCFVDVRAFGKQAETINRFFAKGKPIFVEGRLSFDTWTAQDGSKRSKHRITLESFQFVGGKEPSSYDQHDFGTGQTGGQQQASAQNNQPQGQLREDLENYPAMDDDSIPF